MKLDLNFAFKGIDGKELPLTGKQAVGNADGVQELVDKDIEVNHAGKLLSIALWNSSNGIKFHLWAEQLYKKQPIEVDQVDIDILLGWIDAYNVNPKPTDFIVSDLVVGKKEQLKAAIRKLKDKPKK